MKKLYKTLFNTLCWIFLMLPFLSGAQVTFQKVYPTVYDRTSRAIEKTADGGYLLAGMSNNSNMADCDVYVQKTDANGNFLWDKTFGGNKPDYAYNMLPTYDGNYFIIGYSYSFSGGDQDVYLLKMDPNGNKIWEKTFIGWGNEEGREIIKTSDGNFLIVGSTNSNLSSQDVFIMKIDPDGVVLWIKYYGGAGKDSGNSVKECGDGGFIVGGETESFGQGGDAYLVRTNSHGDTLWTRHWGGAQADEIVSVVANNDDSFTFAVRDSSEGRDVDVRITKCDGAGSIVWSKLFSGTEKDTPKMINHTSDGGYIVGAISRSFGWINPDMWLMKLTAAGDTSWTRHFGDSDHEHCYCAKESDDGGYLAIGHSRSYSPGQKVMFVKTNASGVVSVQEELVQSSPLIIYPNPSSDGNVTIKGVTAQKCKLKLYNSAGQLLSEKSEEMLRPEDTRIVDLKGRSAGIYFVSIETENAVRSAKILLK